VGDYQLRSRKITPHTPRSFPDSDEPQTSTPIMNNQPDGVGNRRNHTDNGEEPQFEGAKEEQFVSRTLLDYAAPRATDARGPIILPRLIEEPPSYGASTISIMQNNYYHGLEHEDPHDHIQTFLQCLGAVRPNGAFGDYIRLALFPFTLKNKAKRWLNSLPRDSIGT
jgi:hypothetical protein